MKINHACALQYTDSKAFIECHNDITIFNTPQSDLLKEWLGSEADVLTPSDQPEELDSVPLAAMDVGLLSTEGPENDNDLPGLPKAEDEPTRKQDRGKGERDTTRKKKASKTKSRATEGLTGTASGQKSIQGTENVEMELDSEKQSTLAGGKRGTKEGRKQKKNKRKKEWSKQQPGPNT